MNNNKKTTFGWFFFIICFDTYDCSTGLKDNNEAFLEVFKNYLIFKVEDPELLTNIFDENQINIRDLKDSRLGEFYYAYKDQVITLKKFKTL